MIAGLLFFLDELVQLRIAVARALGYAGVKILIVKRIGVICGPAGIVKRQLAAVDAVASPINRVLLRHELGFYAALCELSGDHLADFLAFEMAIRRQIELDFEAIGVARFGE